MTKPSLLFKLIAETGITKEQAVESLLIVTEFAKECYPILRGNIGMFVEEEIANAQKTAMLSELSS